MKKEDQPAFGELTQTEFEDAVRQAWKIAGTGYARLHPKEMALAIARVVLAADTQPRLMTGRAMHNLGKEKADWVRDLMAQKPTKVEEEPCKER